MVRMATTTTTMDDGVNYGEEEDAMEMEGGVEMEMGGGEAFVGPQAMGVDAGSTSVQYSLPQRMTLKSGALFMCGWQARCKEGDVLNSEACCRGGCLPFGVCLALLRIGVPFDDHRQYRTARGIHPHHRYPG
jgi:hypothetical protein